VDPDGVTQAGGKEAYVAGGGLAEPEATRIVEDEETAVGPGGGVPVVAFADEAGGAVPGDRHDAELVVDHSHLAGFGDPSLVGDPFLEGEPIRGGGAGGRTAGCPSRRR
jgi:hypothetical protein